MLAKNNLFIYSAFHCKGFYGRDSQTFSITKKSLCRAYALAALIVIILSIFILQCSVLDDYSKSLVVQAEHFKNSTAPNISNENVSYYKPFVGGYILGGLQKLFSLQISWKIISAVSAVLISAFLFLTLISFSTQSKICLLIPLLLAVSQISSAYSKMSPYVVTALFMSLLVFVFFIKTDFFLKWYLAQLGVAFLFIDLPICCILFYIIPIAAFLYAKKYQTAAKSFTLALGVLIFGIALHIFCFFAYRATGGIFAFFNPKNILIALKSEMTFFFLISLIGFFKTSKYVKQYIIPAILSYPLYLLSSLFVPDAKMLAICFIAPIFLGFAASIVHQKIYRKYYRIVFMAIICASIIIPFV